MGALKRSSNHSIRHNQQGIPLLPRMLRPDPLPYFTPSGIAVYQEERYHSDHTLNQVWTERFEVTYRGVKIKFNEDRVSQLAYHFARAIREAVPEAESNFFGTNNRDELSDTRGSLVNFRNQLMRVYNTGLKEKPLEAKIFITPSVKWFGVDKGPHLSVRVIDIRDSGIGIKVFEAVKEVLESTMKMDEKTLAAFLDRDKPADIKPRGAQSATPA